MPSLVGEKRTSFNIYKIVHSAMLESGTRECFFSEPIVAFKSEELLLHRIDFKDCCVTGLSFGIDIKLYFFCGFSLNCICYDGIDMECHLF